MKKSIAKAFCRAFYAVFHPIRVEGKENLPSEGGYILALNHTNFRDAIVGMILAREDARAMAKKELFAHKPVARFLSNLGAFPVDRGNADMESLRLAMDILNEGHPLIIFPEGHRYTDGEIHEIKPGTALIAMRTGAPVIPARIRSTYRPFAPVTVRAGAPFIIEKGRGSQALTDGTEKLKNELEKL